MLRVELSYLDDHTRRRQEIAVAYARGITNERVANPISNSVTVESPKSSFICTSCALRIAMRSKPTSRQWRLTQSYIILSTHKQAAYSQYNNLSLPVTETIHKEVLSLPIGPDMSMDAVNTVIDAVNSG